MRPPWQAPTSEPELWRIFVEQVLQFGRYEDRTDREIPVVILSPAG